MSGKSCVMTIMETLDQRQIRWANRRARRWSRLWSAALAAQELSQWASGFISETALVEPEASEKSRLASSAICRVGR